MEETRAVNDAVARQDFAAVAERLHPDAVWEHNLGMGSPEEGVYRGRDAIVRLFERIVEEIRDGLMVKGRMHTGLADAQTRQEET
jgi:ketosteroid isomerase-like protein